MENQCESTAEVLHICVIEEGELSNEAAKSITKTALLPPSCSSAGQVVSRGGVIGLRGILK